MKKYTYNLFPKPMVVVGYTLIFLSIACILVSIFIIQNGDHLSFPAPVAFMIIGLIMVSFKSRIIIPENFRFILKESNLFAMTLSREKINIPHDCNRILIKQIKKKGTGYYRFVLPVTYSFKSYDMFLCSESGIVRLINTDYSRSLKIAEFIKSNFNIEYILE
jgi:hypothetical protein